MTGNGSSAGEGADAPSPDVLDELLNRGFRYALSLAHDEAVAEDLVQEACLKVLKARGPWHRGYLFPAIRNAFIDRWRRGQRIQMESLCATDPEGDATEPLSSKDESCLADKDLIDRALSHLRPEEREVIYLASVEGYTAQELSDLLGKPRGTILSLIYRSKRKLAAYVGRLDPEAAK